MKIFQLSLYNGTYRDFFQKITKISSPTLVFTPNPEILHHAYYDADFMRILQSATHNVPDGNGLYVAEMMQEGQGFLGSIFALYSDKNNVQKKYGELIKGSDLTKDILENGKNITQKILIIDRKNAIPKNDFEQKKAKMQEKMTDILMQKFPWNSIFVIFEGEKNPDEIADFITKNDIRYVFSTLGMKRQEAILVQIFEKIPKNHPVVGLAVGASIDFLLELQKRSPKIFQNMWLEWLYRLMMQPKIRYKRIKTAVFDFPKLVKKDLQNPKT